MTNTQIYLFSLLQDLKESLGADFLPPHLKDIAGEIDQDTQMLLAKAANIAAEKKGKNEQWLSAIYPQLFQTKEVQTNLKFSKLPLEGSKKCFPTDAPRDDVNLIGQFKSAINGLTGDDPFYLAENLLSLCWRYAWCLPSNRGQGVSLFDYVKVKAGLANALQKNGEGLLLIAGGVSGIQPYIYDIVSSKANKNLKGRSFYVQLVNDAVIYYLLRKTGLTSASVIMNSGGRFILVAPATQVFTEKLQRVVKDISDSLFKEYKMGINLEMVWEEYAAVKFSENSFSDILGALQSKANAHRYKRFSLQILNDATFFEPSDIKGIEDKDAVTNEIIYTGEKWEQLDPDNDELKVKLTTYKQMKIAQWLRNSDAIVFCERSIPDNNNFIKPLGEDIDLFVHFQKDINKDIVPSGQIAYQYSINNFNSRSSQNNVVQAFMFYAGKNVAVHPQTFIGDDGETYHEGQPLTFEQLSADPDSRFTRLGLLRMDVDGLGRVFRDGFDKNQYPHFPCSLAGYSALSRNFDFFFKAHLNNIWEGNDQFKNHTQIIYAGGDDLFLLGKWNNVIQFAETIRNAFREWVCGNEDLTISGGISIVTPKFPVIRAAKNAGEEEDLAKDHEYMGRKKNAVSLFGFPLNWEKEFKEVQRLKNKLKEKVNDKSLPRNYLMKIQTYYEQAGFQKEHDKTEAWRWRIAYDFSRASNRGRNRNATKGLMDEMLKGIFTGKVSDGLERDKYEYFDLLYIASVWASYETRLNEKTSTFTKL